MFQTVFPVHHQELKTAHTASGIFQTVTATCCRVGTASFIPARLAAGSPIGRTNIWRCMCSFELHMMDGKPRLKHVQRPTEINTLWNVACCWLYAANILAMQRPTNVKFTEFNFLNTEFLYILFYLKDLRVDGRIIFKWIFKKWHGGHGLDWSGSGQEQMTGCCVWGNETLGSIQCKGFLE